MSGVRCSGVAACANHPEMMLGGEPICAVCHDRITRSLEKPEECASCGWPTKKLVSYSADKMNETNGREKRWLCRICAGTSAGNATLYLYDDNRIQRTVAAVGNILLEYLEKIDKRLERIERTGR